MNDTLKILTKLHIAGMISKAAKREVEIKLQQNLLPKPKVTSNK